MNATTNDATDRAAEQRAALVAGWFGQLRVGIITPTEFRERGATDAEIAQYEIDDYAPAERTNG